MPNTTDLMFKTFTAVHKFVFRASGGRLLGRGSGMPVLILTTTGRKSGKTRDTMLTTPLREDETIVIVASKGGSERHPAWFLNLRSDPAVQVTIDGETRSMSARIVEGDERQELWTRLTAAHANYAGYQTKTEREIPVIVLEP